jgi:hypothetical protein
MCAYKRANGLASSAALSDVLSSWMQHVIRVRPLMPDEPRNGDLRVVDNNRKVVLIEPGKLQGTAKDEYSADYVYVDSKFNDIYERSLVPMILRDENGAPGFMDGVDCCVMCFGPHRSGKTYTAHGSGPAASDGVVPMVIQGVFDAISEKLDEAKNAKRKLSKWRHRLSMQFVEVVDEKIIDLLNAQRLDLDVDQVGTSDGLGIRNLTRKWIDTDEEMMRYFRVGQAARTTARTEFGPMHERSTAIFCIELHQASAP